MPINLLDLDKNLRKVKEKYEKIKFIWDVETQQHILYNPKIHEKITNFYDLRLNHGGCGLIAKYIFDDLKNINNVKIKLFTCCESLHDIKVFGKYNYKKEYSIFEKNQDYKQIHFIHIAILYNNCFIDINGVFSKKEFKLKNYNEYKFYIKPIYNLNILSLSKMLKIKDIWNGLLIHRTEFHKPLKIDIQKAIKNSKK